MAASRKLLSHQKPNTKDLNMFNEKSLKRIALLLAVVFVNQIFFPTAALALTGGPGQPELESFAPFNSTDLVDPFSGDFKYNIPLLNVPGPNGGYPINISYSGNVSVDQEAGWVGLGWSLNPGAINRQLRGLPDDFDGSQEITRERKMKPNRTYTLGVGSSFSEVFGFDMSKISKDLQLTGNLNLTMNNYNGFNMDLGLGFAIAENDATKGAKEAQADPSASKKTPSTKKSFASKMSGWLKEEKIEGKIYSKKNLKKHYKNSLKSGVKNAVGRVPSAAFFAGSGDNLSSIDFPRTSNSFSFEGKLGAAVFGFTADVEFRLFYSQQDYSKSSISYPAYGYMHTEPGTKNDGAILDYYTDKNSTLNPSSAFLPIPILTNDVYTVTGQGVGGVYRPQMGTVPLLATPYVKSNSDSYGFGLDLSGSPSDIKVGVNPKASFTDSKSGRWTSGDAYVSYFRESLNLDAQTAATFEQNTFLKLGDLTDNEWHNEKMFNTNQPLRFDMNTEFHGVSFKPRIISQLYPSSGGSFVISKPDRIREKRAARTNLFKYFTGKDLITYNGASTTHREITTLTIPATGTTATVGTSAFQTITSESLIHEIAVENQGVNYVYGIPVFTHSKMDKTFSVSPSGKDPATSNGTVSFGSNDDSHSNAQGRGAMFNSNNVDRFAHAYLITEIFSDDYVDIKDDGPTSDDFGSYTKFDYYKAYSDFTSRSPAASTVAPRRASLITGTNSDNEDDMASYSETKKDIYYVHKIETKTHYAEFFLAPREDDYGYTPNLSGAQKLAKLKKVTLYKKNVGGADTEIKSVEFEYNEDEASPNNIGLMDGAPVAINGKLTLKRIRFTFEGFKTDTYLNPYEFDYYNQTYEEGAVDKWGKFQPPAKNDFDGNYLYPYVAQNRDLDNDGVTVGDEADDIEVRSSWARAWQLRTITLPTGGEVEINYESDDYKYVQDKEAQSMFEIVGINSPGSWNLNSNKIYFKLKEEIPTANANLVGDQLSKNVDNVYFKALVVLKTKPSQYNIHSGFNEAGKVKEFVDGYLNFNNIGFDANCLNSSGEEYKYGYITVDNVSGSKNPIRMAGVQHMRINGQHFNPSFSIGFTGGTSNSNILNIATKIIKGATQDKEQNKNFIEAAFGIKSYATKMSNSLASVIRLNAQDGLKYGGGSRVKEIIVKDNWNTLQGSETTFNTKQVYTYKKEDGSSSGVAEYEPLAGGEESPFKQPYYYSQDKGVFKNPDLLFELPATEALYPSASVGYSRIVVETVPINTDGTPITGYTLSSNGIIVQEFYTAKDYPVRSTATKIKKVNMSKLLKYTRFIGGKNFFNPGFSQGYYTELNDMHGKVKRTSTYSTTLGTSEAPFQSITYYYKTENGGFVEGRYNRLSSDVNVLTNDGFVETKTLGEVAEAYVEMVEDETQTIGGDIKINVDNLVFGFIPIPIPTALPDIDYSYSMRRTAVMNKLVSRTAILEKVITQQEGRTTIANSVLFDYENGQPLLTQVINDFNAPIYTYNRPQHWLNDEFKGPWRNWNAKVNGATWKGVIQNGDIIINSGGDRFWVSDAEHGNLINREGISSTITNEWVGGTILESGYSGKTSTMSSQIVSLNDPASSDSKDFVLFEKFNNKNGWLGGLQDALNHGQLHAATAFYNCDADPLYDCSVPDNSVTFCPLASTETHYLHFSKPGTTGIASITFPEEWETQMADFTLKKIGNKVQATLGNIVLLLDWSDPYNLFLECMPGVLDAGATLYADGHRNYKVLDNGEYTITYATDVQDNPVRYKDQYNYKPVQTVKGINTRVYTDVAATDGFFETKIQNDGSYSAYIDYNFGAPVDKNIQWLNTGEITQYDPFGNELENRNPLGVYSSEIFNKDHTLVTANAANAEYTEIAYQNFEDLSGLYSGSHGNIQFSSGAPVVHTGGHTGDKSLLVSHGATLSFTELKENKKYRLSFWQQTGTPIPITSTGTITTDAKNIDGWDLRTFTFKTGVSSTTASVVFAGIGKIDDIRLYPADAAIKTFVYDLNTHRLIAQLDANNFATLYGYNEEGTLAFVKKETNRGIQTVSNNIIHYNK